MFRILTLIFILNSLTLTTFSQLANPKLLIIGLDGIRPDALKVAHTPNLDLLTANGLHSFDALTQYPTKTVPGFASMMCGVWNDKHGIQSNSLSGNSRLNRYPYFLRYVENFNSSLETAICTNSGLFSLQQHIINDIDTAIYATKDDVRKNLGVLYLSNHDPDIFFQYFGGADFFGHNHTFSPTDTAYTNHISLVDGYVGEILAAVMNRPNYYNEDWLVLVSTDHGGLGSSHGGSSFEERNIFFIASGKNIPAKHITRDSTETIIDSSFAFNGIDNKVSISSQQALQLNTTQDFSIECRVRTGGTNGISYILSNQSSTSDVSKGFSIALNSSGENRWIANIADGTNKAYKSGKIIDDNEYHHLAVVMKRGQTMKIYQDGIYLDQIAIAQLGDATSPIDLSIGIDGAGLNTTYFEGNISEVRIWKAALHDTTIVKYSGQTVDPDHPNRDHLLGYWKMDENNGNVVYDHSGSNLDGVITGNIQQWEQVNAALKVFDYSKTPRLVDISATALQHFCIPINPTWELDGKSWIDYGCAYYPCTPVIYKQTQNINYTSTKLTWSDPGTTDHYILRWKKLSDKTFDYLAINAGSANEKLISTLQPNTSYEWQIQAVCGPYGFPFAPYSERDTFTTLGCPKPEPVFTSHITDSSAQLNWTNNPTSTGYEILGLNIDNNQTYQLSVPASSQQKVLENLSFNNIYVWKVRATCIGPVHSEYSRIDTFIAIDPIDTVSSPINPDPRYPQYEVSIYPNPFNKSTTFKIEGEDETINLIQIKSIAGSVMKIRVASDGPKFTFENTDLPKGIYFIEIFGKKVYRGKMIIN